MTGKGGNLFEKVMKQSVQPDLRYQPLYTLGEVSRYARVKPATLRSWTHNGDARVIIPANVSGVAPFSFINLIELYVLEGFEAQLSRTDATHTERRGMAASEVWIFPIPLAECEP